MKLTPLFEGETHEKHLRTIKENVEIIGCRLYGNKEQAIADKLGLMEHAFDAQWKQFRQA
jgi:hypothetical protein